MSTWRRPAVHVSDAGGGLLALAVVVWSALAANATIQLVTLPSPWPAGLRTLLLAPLAAAAAALLFREHTRRLRQFALVTGLVAAALLFAQRIEARPGLGLALPALVLIGLVVSRRPAVGVATLLAITATFGLLTAYLSAPYTQVFYVVLAALWLSVLTPVVLERRTAGLSLPPLAVPLAAFLVVSVIEGVASEDVQGALRTLRLDHLYTATALLGILASWSLATRERIGHAIVLIAASVGAYATLRLLTGPTTAEAQLAARSPYNFIDGKLKLTGSLPNGGDLGAWTALAVPFCAACALSARGRWRVIGVSAAVLCILALVESGVRAGVIAVGIGLITVFFGHQLCRAQIGLRLGATLAAIGIAFVVLFGSFAVAGSDSSIHRRFGSLFSADDPSRVEHASKWRLAVQDLDGHPFGFGVGTAATGYDAIRRGTARSQSAAQGVDSGYLKIASEQGFPVLILYALALAALLAGIGHRALTVTDPVRAWLGLGACGTLASLGTLLFASAYMEGLPSLVAWVVVGLGAGAVGRGQARDVARGRYA